MRVGRGANSPIPENVTVTKPPELMEEDHGGGQDPHRVVAPVKKKKNACLEVLYCHVPLVK
jgi:hypothetical protein